MAVSSTQERVLGRKMGGQIPCDRNKNMPALGAVTPLAKLPHARLKHLVGIEARVLPGQRLRKAPDQGIGRVTQRKVTGDEARRSSDLLLAVKRVEKSDTDLLGRDRQVI
jgi:hypothetical protein